MIDRLGPILVVDDEDDIRNLLLLHLRREGFAAVGAANGFEALDLAQRSTPSLVMLDLMLPGLSGTEVCKRLRADPATRDVPVIMLSARGEEIDRVVGFEVGADDYVTKPFSARELLLRVRAVLRRAPTPDEPADGIRTFGAPASILRIDEPGHHVYVRDEEIPLTATEFKLLLSLAQRVDRVQTRGQLLQEVWDMPPDLNTRTVDTHMKRLREKLLDASAHIETVRGVGYRFRREVD
ncbi:MAG: response regulator transcription factor [Myxococcales bacterium]|nr:response regulator transcription factor [Myxococcales bacterium]